MDTNLLERKSTFLNLFATKHFSNTNQLNRSLNFFFKTSGFGSVPNHSLYTTVKCVLYNFFNFVIYFLFLSLELLFARAKNAIVATTMLCSFRGICGLDRSLSLTNRIYMCVWKMFHSEKNPSNSYYIFLLYVNFENPSN